MYLQKYENWKNTLNLDTQLKNELDRLSLKEIEDSFYKDLEFGTGGLRAKLGVGTNRLNIYTIRKSTEGYARWLLKQGLDSYGKGIVIAYDNRHMSREFALESAKILATHKIKSFVFSSLRPTPELSFAIRYLNAFGGIVITASHNPKEYNGYKIYDETGCQCVLRYTKQIIKEINAVGDPLNVPIKNKNETDSYIYFIDKEVDEAYYNEILKIQINPQLYKENLKIVFSPQHGTANIPVKEVLKRARYNVIPVESQCTPDPDFSNTKDPNPENIVAFEEGLKVAQAINADCIICTDPDCDRLGVMVKHNNEYVALTGNQTGAILLQYIIKERIKNKTLPNNPIVYNTIVTSSLGDFICQKYGIPVEKTLTGFKFIGDKIHDIEDNKKYTFLFGYEESYGYLISDCVRDKDGVQSCLIISEIINYYKQHNLTLIDVLNNIYKEFGHYIDLQKSIKIDGKDGIKTINEIMNCFRNPQLDYIGNLKIIAKEDYKLGIRISESGKEQLSLPQSNVIKLFLEDNSWIAVRPSGTEPKIKFYLFTKNTKLINDLEALVDAQK